MTAPNRLTKKNVIGRRKVLNPLKGHQHKSLGGIPMKIKNGKIVYAQHVPHNYTKDDKGSYFDKESIERQNPVQRQPSFIRQHIYETRFAIGEETNEERRKREYKEWMEGNL